MITFYVGLERSHLLGKIAMLFPKSRAFRERCDPVAPSVAEALEGLRFAPSRGATNAFRRWITEALHPPYLFFYNEDDVSPNRFVLRGNPGVCRSEYVPVPLNHGDVWSRHCH